MSLPQSPLLPPRKVSPDDLSDFQTYRSERTDSYLTAKDEGNDVEKTAGRSSKYSEHVPGQGVNQALVHGALMLGQTINGCGSIIGHLGLGGVNPVLFALVREGCAAPIFILLAWAFEGR